MTRFLYSAFFLLLLSGNLSGKDFNPSYTASLPLFDELNNLGDVEVEIENEKLLWVDRDSLIETLKAYIAQDTLLAMKKLPSKVTPLQLPFPFRFDPEELKLKTKIDLKFRARVDTGMASRFEEERKTALQPAPIGGAINYGIEQNWGDEGLGGNFFTAQVNSFINLNSLVLETQGFYQSNIDNHWNRGDTRVVKDFQGSNIRTQVGDVYPQIQGFMQGRPLGGVNIQRNFSIDPYRLPYPTGQQEFTLRSRSFVKYFVNSVLVKSEYLPAGNYNARDIPLNNGLNTVVIEATDELGQTQVFVFRSSSNINLLNEGESRFDLSYGIPFLDLNFQRKYLSDDGEVFSGFYQFGFSSIFSSSLYHQRQGTYTLYGTEMIQAVPIGNLTLGMAYSDHTFEKGGAASLGYQLITNGRKWFDSHTISLRYENRAENFKTALFDSSSVAQNVYAANYTIPVSNLFTLSMGGNYGDVRNNSLNDRFGYDLNMSFRLFNNHNVTVYASRNRDEFRQWNDVAYVFLTFSLPESNSYVSTLYDLNQKSGRLNVLQDNQNRLYKVRTQAVAETTYDRKIGELDFNYPTPLGDLGARLGASQLETSALSGRGSLRLNSAFVFACQSECGAGISRPIPGSFVLFRPEPRLSDQSVGLKSTSPFTEAESGLFNEIVFSNLIAYQYRDVQLDPTFLDIGRSLEQEKFTLYPTYRSAHLISLKEKGSVILTGQLVDFNGSPLSLKVGKIGDITFFSNRNGEIFVEGLEAGTYELNLEGRDYTESIHIRQQDRGIKDLGSIQLRENDL